MIQAFVDRFISQKALFKANIRQNWDEFDEYSMLVKAVVTAITDEDEFSEPVPDPERIHVLGGGEYSGTLLFVIGCKHAYSDTYWYVMIDYGSCSGCDSLAAAHLYDPTDTSVDDVWTLCLHIVQRLKRIGGDE